MKIQIDWKGMNYLIERADCQSPCFFLLLLLLQWQQIDLQKQTNEGDISNYQTNGEFDLINFEAIHSVQFYSCCPEPYPDITVPFLIHFTIYLAYYMFKILLKSICCN